MRICGSQKDAVKVTQVFSNSSSHAFSPFLCKCNNMNKNLSQMERPTVRHTFRQRCVDAFKNHCSEQRTNTPSCYLYFYKYYDDDNDNSNYINDGNHYNNSWNKKLQLVHNDDNNNVIPTRSLIQQPYKPLTTDHILFSPRG